MGEKIELHVDAEEFERIKRRVKSGAYLDDLPALEDTLLILRYRYLSEKLVEVEKRLEEMKEHWKSLVEFQEKAQRDKEFMMEFRRMLSDENHALEERVRSLAGCD